MSYTSTPRLSLSKPVVGSNQAFETSVLNANWDKIDAEAVAADVRLDAIEATDVTQNGRLTSVEGVNTTQNGRLDAIETLNTTQTSRLDGIDTLNTTQNGRLDVVEARPTTNYVINGGFDIWQRGTTGFTTNAAYTADRWIASSSAGTFAVSQSLDVPTNVGVQYSLSMVATGGTNPLIRHRIEAANGAVLAGRQVTLSFYAKSTNGSFPLKVQTAFPTTTADVFSATTADLSAQPVAPSGNLSSSWTRYSLTFTVSANAVRGYQIDIYRESTAANSTTLITGVQLELGAIASTFARTGGTLQGELAECQRYYVRFAPTANLATYGVAMADTSSSLIVALSFPVQMRDIPSSMDNLAAATYYYLRGSANVSITGLGMGSVSQWFAVISVTAAVTAGNAYSFRNSTTAGGYLGFSAEL